MANSRKRTRPETELPERLSAVLSEVGVSSDSRLCVALSGGVDSVVLLHLLTKQRERFGYALSAAHVHHGLSLNADKWRDFCDDLCRSLAVPLRFFHVDVDHHAGSGLEAAARQARLAALSDIETDWLMLGHHLDDQAETVLFRLLRGAGVHGAAAMPVIECGHPGRLRPLLNVRREDIVAYARQCQLAWVEDESNADWRFIRNRLRHDILPRLEDVFPAAATTLARAASHFREAGDLLDELAAMDQDACGGERLDLTALLMLTDARLRNLLRWKIRGMERLPPSAAWLSEAVRQLRATTGQPLYLHHEDLVFCVYRGQLWLDRPVVANAAHHCIWQGETCLPWVGGTVHFRHEPGQGVSRDKLERADVVMLTTRWSSLRMRLAYDRPFRSFKNLCQEAAVPSWLRECLPVLRVDGEAAWVAGVGVAADFASRDGENGISPLWIRR